MKLTAKIAGEKYGVEIKQEGARVVALIDERRYEVEARASSSDSLLLINGNSVYECRVQADRAVRESVEVSVGTNDYFIELTDPKRLRGAGQAGAHASGSAQIVAPMPGKVVRVLTEKGASVEAGQGVVVIEAMKMQNEMKSPKAGLVTTINVEAVAT